VVADSHHFDDEQDPDPHSGGKKSCSVPDPHSSDAMRNPAQKVQLIKQESRPDRKDKNVRI
jgi:hypothetical protein